MVFCFYSRTSIVSVSMLWNSNNTNSWATFVSEENHRHVVDCKSLQPSVWFVGCHWAPFVNQWLVKSQNYQSSADAIYTTMGATTCLIYNMVATCLVSDVWCCLIWWAFYTFYPTVTQHPVTWTSHKMGRGKVLSENILYQIHQSLTSAKTQSFHLLQERSEK